jgi:hypothetical protein
MPGQMARSRLTSLFLSEGSNLSALQFVKADPAGWQNGEELLSARMRENKVVLLEPPSSKRSAPWHLYLASPPTDPPPLSSPSVSPLPF